jgi:hypothetical protein
MQPVFVDGQPANPTTNPGFDLSNTDTTPGLLPSIGGQASLPVLIGCRFRATWAAVAGVDLDSWMPTVERV